MSATPDKPAGRWDWEPKRSSALSRIYSAAVPLALALASGTTTTAVP